MADCSPGVSQQAADTFLFNFKALADQYVHKNLAQAPMPNAWELLMFTAAKDAVALSNRRNNNSATVDHFINMATAGASATAQQTGQTENEQTVSPAGTAASETAKGAVADAGAGIATAAEGIATANQAIADALAAFVAGVNTNAANLAAALGAVLVTAAGGASTPSQTQAKPTAAPSPAAL